MAWGHVVFAMDEVLLLLRVEDVDAALTRAAACRPVYGADDDVLLVSKDPFAGEVTLCYVPTTAPRITFVVPEGTFRVRGHRSRAR